jgi:quinohemoprotein ethanol dehydrogenase
MSASFRRRGRFPCRDLVLEATPLVVDGVMYTTQPARWSRSTRERASDLAVLAPQKVRNPYEINPFNRGVAVLGNRLFVGTLDAALVALDAERDRRSGKRRSPTRCSATA